MDRNSRSCGGMRIGAAEADVGTAVVGRRVGGSKLPLDLPQRRRTTTTNRGPRRASLGLHGLGVGHGRCSLRAGTAASGYRQRPKRDAPQDQFPKPSVHALSPGKEHPLVRHCCVHPSPVKSVQIKSASVASPNVLP
jgi:hypothetical protein